VQPATKRALITRSAPHESTTSGSASGKFRHEIQQGTPTPDEQPSSANRWSRWSCVAIDR